MRYLGGKYRLRNKISRVLNSLREPDQIYWEPFVGSAWVTTRINNRPVYCSDVSYYLIEMWKALLSGWVPPDSISEQEYYDIKSKPYKDPPLTAFVGYGCSWGGKWFGGYARGENRNWAGEAKRSLLKKVKQLKPLNPKFFLWDFIKKYKSPFEKKCFIYCDPPYANTTGYDITDEWNPNKFWNIVRKLSLQGHTIVVSEYSAPEDFICIAEFPTKTDLNTSNGKDNRIERLFTCNAAKLLEYEKGN